MLNITWHITLWKGLSWYNKEYIVIFIVCEVVICCGGVLSLYGDLKQKL